MVDRVVEIDGYKSGVGIKNISMSEPALQGHFPGDPVFPGVLIIEAMAQTSGVIGAVGAGEVVGAAAGGRIAIVSIDNCRFRKPVLPGDQLRLLVTTKRGEPGGRVWQFTGEATVDGEVVATAGFTGLYDATPVS
jgi:3-hydroxyacyl-[acyl-carrier-protein] dehydratase